MVLKIKDWVKATIAIIIIIINGIVEEHENSADGTLIVVLRIWNAGNAAFFYWTVTSVTKKVKIIRPVAMQSTYQQTSHAFSLL